jgi:hypothetical protein
MKGEGRVHHDLDLGRAEKWRHYPRCTEVGNTLLHKNVEAVD